MAMAACCPAMPPCVREDSHWALEERMQRASFSRVSTPIVRGRGRICVVARMSGGSKGGRGGGRGGRGGPKRISSRPRRPSGNRNSPVQEPERPQEEGPALNYDIRVPLVRLIDQDQKQVGIVPTPDALLRAQRSRCDLVLVAPDANPPVAKILNYGKYKYEQRKKKDEAQKKAGRQDTKELRIRYNIAEHDYRVRVKQALKFLKSGDKVKVVMQFKARENQHKQAGVRLLMKFQEEFSEISALEGRMHTEGSTFFMTIVPVKHLIERAEKIKARAAAAAAAVASGDGDAQLSDLSEISDISDVSDVSEIEDFSEDDDEQDEESQQIEASGEEQAGSNEQGQNGASEATTVDNFGFVKQEYA